MFPFQNHKNRKTHSPLLCWDVAQESLFETYANDCPPIGGFQKLSLIDYPGYMASVLFTSGCNMRCSYCHNMQLVDPKQITKTEKISPGHILHYLRENSSMIDAVVISGGEPTMHKNLPELIRTLKRMSFMVKLDTNGTNPNMLGFLIREELVDYIAMDVKAPFILKKYHAIAGYRFSKRKLKSVMDSLALLNNSRIEFECRTTTNQLLTNEDYHSIAANVKGRYYIQYNEQDFRKPFTRLSYNDFCETLTI